MTEEERKIVTGEFNPELVMSAISKQRCVGYEPDYYIEHERVATMILLPPIIIIAFYASREFKVPKSVGFFKICESYLSEEQKARFF